MAFESVRGYIQFASGLGDMTKARAMEAAEGLMSLPLVGDAGKVAGQASALADQILEAASANRASLIALVRQEVDSSMERAEIARRADLEAARQVIAALATQVQELSEMVRTGRAGQAVSGAATEAVAIGALAVKGPEAVIADEARRRAHLEAEGRDAELEGLDGEVLSVDEALAVAEPAAAQPAAARRRPARASFARTGAAKTAATKATAKKATAKKATAKKATAKK
ncbi:MAG: hypothetical protein LWW86_16845, partial [Micrococcales bacterium]|nr:hypothetical protein [Micrococcales bacterium]